MDELKRLRDEIRQDLRRATLELRDEWKELERRLPDPAVAAEQLRGATADMADRLVDELRKFRARMQRGAGATDAASASELMSRPVITCAAGDSLARAITTMWEKDVGFLPVVDQDQRILGTVTDRDSAVAASTRGQRFDEIPVNSVMSRDVVSCPPATSPAQVLALMKQHQIRRVPVVEDGRIVGVLTINDLVRFCAGAGDKGGISAGDLVDALAAIAKPRQSNGDRAA
jgi:CBS domain-containing protein